MWGHNWKHLFFRSWATLVAATSDLSGFLRQSELPTGICQSNFWRADKAHTGFQLYLDKVLWSSETHWRILGAAEEVLWLSREAVWMDYVIDGFYDDRAEVARPNWLGIKDSKTWLSFSKDSTSTSVSSKCCLIVSWRARLLFHSLLLITATFVQEFPTVKKNSIFIFSWENKPFE